MSLARCRRTDASLKVGDSWWRVGTLTVTDTVIVDNRAVLESAFPSTVETSAEPGGVLIHGGVTTATFERTEMTGNDAMMTSRLGEQTRTLAGSRSCQGWL